MSGFFVILIIAIAAVVIGLAIALNSMHKSVKD